MKKIAFLFDGQGAFKPGVGRDLCRTYPEAQKVVARSSALLGYDLTEYLWGEKATITSDTTSIAQPAISTISLAYAEVLKNTGCTPLVSLGHSLGEVTAVVYCGVVTFDDGMRIIQKRGEVMEKSGKQGTMTAVINVDLAILEEMCTKVSQETTEPVVVANINAPGQIVISGSRDGIKRIVQSIAQHGGRGIPLSVGGAWHSPYLTNAAEEFMTYVDTVRFREPTSQFFSVCEQTIVREPAAIKDSIKNQMLARVDWVSAIEHLIEQGYDTFVEIGPSKILKELVIKINRQVRVESTAQFTDLHTLAQSIL